MIEIKLLKNKLYIFSKKYKIKYDKDLENMGEYDIFY